MHIAGFSPTAAQRQPDGSVLITGSDRSRTDGGSSLVLDTAEFGLASVRFDDLTGVAEQVGDVLTLSGIEGRGRIVVTPAQ